VFGQRNIPSLEAIGGVAMELNKKKNSSMSRVCVNIFNEEYVVKGDENPE